MHVVVASDKFKGSLTAAEVARHLHVGIRSHLPEQPIVAVPVADGGEGTLIAAVSAGFTAVPVLATGPVGQPVQSYFAARGGVAVVELADVSGLHLLAPGRLDPMAATSFGTGEVVRAALDRGCHTIVLGLGGSASTDGGAGMLQALGARIATASGDAPEPGGAALRDVVSVDLSTLDPRLARTSIVLASDVDNPLVGPLGAATVYGPQKGTTPAQVELLDAALEGWAVAIGRALGTDPGHCRPGAGAAGGVGFAAMAALGAHRRPGIDVVLDLVGFRDHLRGARLVVTGEGCLDEQTLHGKTPAGVAAAATAVGVPVVAVSGRRLLDDAAVRGMGLRAAYALTDLVSDPDTCIRDAGRLLEALGARLARDHLTGPVLVGDPHASRAVAGRRPEDPLDLHGRASTRCAGRGPTHNYV